MTSNILASTFGYRRAEEEKRKTTPPIKPSLCCSCLIKAVSFPLFQHFITNSLNMPFRDMPVHTSSCCIGLPPESGHIEVCPDASSPTSIHHLPWQSGKTCCIMSVFRQGNYETGSGHWTLWPGVRFPDICISLHFMSARPSVCGPEHNSQAVTMLPIRSTLAANGRELVLLLLLSTQTPIDVSTATNNLNRQAS